MMEAFTVTTPTASTEVHTPPAPALGFEDSYEPYSPPRKSSRLQQKRAVNRTPSPKLPSRHYSSQSLGSPRLRNKKQHHIADMASPPPTSPQKKRMPPTETVRRASGSLTAESTASAAAALGLSLHPDTPSKSEARRGRTTMGRATGMLPTPAKTPQKPPTEQQRANITRISRNLFPNHSDDEMMPPTKKARDSDYTLDSFSVADTDGPIAIYTDSHERVPEVDSSSDNPFYGGHPAGATEPSRRRSKRHTVSIPGEGKVSIEDAVRRSDGMLIVFRGKKQFRKFADSESSGPSEALDEGDGGLEGAVETQLRRPLTRSSIKPRLLFPTSKEDDVEMAHDDEEAPTDIEDHLLLDGENDEDEIPETPTEKVSTPDTPKAPGFAPVSPPTTKRTARHGVKSGAEVTPMKKPKSTSPFSQWPRTKSHGHKRPAESQSPVPESAKRTKL